MPSSYGQVVVGPPGSGKTTYCHGMKQFCDATGRKTVIINLDPANDELPYECDVSVFELINLTEVMDYLKLGPNGGLLYCMEYLEKNIDWLKAKLKPLQEQNYYFLFDCPGQVELYTHHNAVKRIFGLLQKLEFRLVAVHLVDSHYCSDPAKFISVLLTSLCTMLHVELPHVNVLSKVDLVEKYGKLPFNLDFFTEVLDLRFLLERFSTDTFLKKYAKLNKVLTDVIQDYSLVSFSTLYIEDKESVSNLLKVIDKANGYIFQGESEESISSMLSCAVGADFEYFRSAAVQEKYMQQEDTDFQFDI